ncbi:MAG: class I SAM-dependent methyltransferase [Bacteroidota bacterium]
MHEYDQIAEWYASARSPDAGLADVRDFVRRLPPHARILDLGCGTGVPTTQFLVQEGFGVAGLDSSAEMVARFRARFPEVPVRCGRAQDARYPTASFGAVVAWGVLFHLEAKDQTTVIQRVADWLTPGGRFLFTSAEEAGTREDEMDGVTFPYVSLGVEGYRDALEAAGLRLEAHHRNAWDNHVYLAHKTA